MDSYNPRRSELYLRKALFIRDKYKESSNDFKIKSSQLIMKTDMTSRDNFQSTYHLDYQYSNSNLLKNSESQTDYSLNEKYASNEEKNNIAEILFDLGCLLSTYESKFSKREGIDCLRRSHDIKIVILGANHPDCLSIKNKINDLVRENASRQARKNSGITNNREQYIPSRNSSSVSRPTTSVKSFVETSPKVELQKCLKEIKKQADFNINTNNDDDFNKWLKKNSIIELIPSRLDKDIKHKIVDYRNLVESQLDFDQSEEDEFVKYFPNNYESNEKQNSSTLDFIPDHIQSDSKSVQRIPLLPEKSILVKSKQNKALTAKLKFTQSKSASGVRLSEFSSDLNNKNTYHSRHCKCPTAVSIDIHNTKTVHGPHSCINDLLNTRNSAQNAQTKILKRIYYKSTWYDIPPGSIGYRFKNYVKVVPNA